MNYVNSLNSIMSYAVKQRETISNNISNQATPNFKAEVVNWNEKMNSVSALKTTNEKHIPVGGISDGKPYEVSINDQVEVNSDGNSVDLNKEMINMLKSNQVSSLSVQAINSHYEARGAARGK